jgi:hypothetical protein
MVKISSGILEESNWGVTASSKSKEYGAATAGFGGAGFGSATFCGDGFLTTGALASSCFGAV